MAAARRPKGQGGVRNRGSDRTPNWVPYFYVPDPSKTSGRRQILGPGQRRKADAEAWLRSQLEARDRGRTVLPNRITFGEVLDDWLSIDGHRLAPNTVAEHRNRIEQRIRPALGDRRVADLRPADVSAFLHSLRQPGARARGDANRGLAESTIGLYYQTINRSLGWATRQRIIPANPLDDIDPPKPAAAELEVWTPANLAKALDLLADHRHYPLFHLAAFTGARRSELLGLHWTQLDLDNQRMTINRRRVKVAGQTVERPGAKSARGIRTIDLDAGTVAVLRRHRTERRRRRLELGPAWRADPNVFTGNAGGGLHPQDVQTDWSKARRDLLTPAGLAPIRFHALRHTHASILLSQGVPVVDVAERIGDHPATVMSVYAHFIPGRGRDDIEAFADLVAIDER